MGKGRRLGPKATEGAAKQAWGGISAEKARPGVLGTHLRKRVQGEGGDGACGQQGGSGGGAGPRGGHSTVGWRDQRHLSLQQLQDGGHVSAQPGLQPGREGGGCSGSQRSGDTSNRDFRTALWTASWSTPRPTLHPRCGSPSLAPNGRRGPSRWETWTGLDGANDPHPPAPNNTARNPQITLLHHPIQHLLACPPGHSPIELPLESVQPGLHVSPRPSARAGKGDVEEAGSGGRTARQLLVLAATAVPPEAEDVGHS